MRSGSGVAQRAEAGADLLIVGTGEGAEEDGHRPDVVEALVWSADALACSAAEEIWVVHTKHPGAGALVNGITASAAAEIGEREQARGVGVVHQEGVAVAVDFVSPHYVAVAVACVTVLRERRLYLFGESRGLVGESSVMQDFGEFRKLAQADDSKVIGGDEERIDAGVVGRAEHGKNEPNGTRGIAVATKRHSIGGDGGASLEAIGTAIVLAL